VLLVFSVLIKNIMHLSNIWGIMAAILAVIFGTITVTFHESLRAWQKFLAISIIGVLGAAIKLFFGFGFAAFFGTASSVVFSATIASFFSWLITIYYWKILRRETQAAEGKRWEDYISKKKIWKNAVNIFFFSFAAAFILNVDILLVKIITTPEMAGYYSALSILGKIILLLNLSVTGVALPRACKDGHQGRNLHPKIFLTSFFLMLAIGLSLILVYYLVPGMLVVALFGQKYQAVAGNLWLFGLMALILSLLKFEADLAFARHDFRINYFLLLTATIMAAAIFKYHANLGEIAVSVSASFLIGYFFAVFLNFSNKNREITEPIV